MFWHFKHRPGISLHELGGHRAWGCFGTQIILIVCSSVIIDDVKERFTE